MTTHGDHTSNRRPLHAACIAATVIFACGDQQTPTTLIPFAELPWRSVGPPPECTASAMPFVAPNLAPISGDIRVEFSAVLQPIGILERVEITVTTNGDRDDSANGAIAIDLDGGGEVVSISDVVEGRATADVVFRTPGDYVVTASFVDDGRTGTTGVRAYTTQLAVWELDVDADELERISDNPGERIKINGALSIEGNRHPVKLRLHGGSSRFFPKTSFRFDLKEGATAAGQRHLILRAEFADKSLLRNWLGYELFRNGTWLPTPDSEFVHFRINGRYYGVMNHVERIDDDYLTRRDMSRTASLYEADPPLEYILPGGNLTPIPEQDYAKVYQWHNGGANYEDLRDLVEFVLQVPQEASEVVLHSEVSVDSYVSYVAMMATIQNHDHIRKNYYLYRDVQADESRWQILPWDLDLSLGHLWGAADDVLDDHFITDADPLVGMKVRARGGFYNQLIDRVLTTETFYTRFLAILEHIHNTVFTEDFIESRLQSALCRMTPDLLADTRKRTSNSTYLDQVETLRRFVRERRPIIRSLLLEGRSQL